MDTTDINRRIAEQFNEAFSIAATSTQPQAASPRTAEIMAER